MVTKKPKTILEFDEVELFETSAVGIPSYAYAHKSFAKSLKDLFPGKSERELNYKELQNMSEEEEAKAKAEAEAAAEAEAKAKAEADAAEADAGKGTEKSASLKDMTEVMAKAVSLGIAKGIEAVQKERGLADTKTPAEKQAELLKKASNGELFAAAFNMGGVQ